MYTYTAMPSENDDTIIQSWRSQPFLKKTIDGYIVCEIEQTIDKFLGNYYEKTIILNDNPDTITVAQMILEGNLENTEEDTYRYET